MKPLEIFQKIKTAAEAVMTLEEPGTDTPEFHEWQKLIDRLHELSIQSGKDWVGKYYDWLYRNNDITKEEAEYFTKYWKEHYDR